MNRKSRMPSGQVIYNTSQPQCRDSTSQRPEFHFQTESRFRCMGVWNYLDTDFVHPSICYTQEVFRSLDPGEEQLLDSMTRGSRFLPANRVLLNEGGVGPYMYRIVTGWAYRYRVAPNGSRQILDFLLPGEIIGLQGSIFGILLHSVRSLTPLCVNTIDCGILREAIRNHPGLTVRLLKHFAAESARTDELLAATGCYDAVGRLSFLMLYLYSRHEERGNVDALECPFPLRRRHMADALGLTGAHINRTLNFLRNERIAFVEHERLSILDLPRLREFVGGTCSAGKTPHLVSTTR